MNVSIANFRKGSDPADPGTVEGRQIYPQIAAGPALRSALTLRAIFGHRRADRSDCGCFVCHLSKPTTADIGEFSAQPEVYLGRLHPKPSGSLWSNACPGSRI